MQKCSSLITTFFGTALFALFLPSLLEDYCVRCSKPTDFLAAFTFAAGEEGIDAAERMPFAGVEVKGELFTSPL
jgi:hypothetical protein